MDYADLVHELEAARHEARCLLVDREAKWVSLGKLGTRTLKQGEALAASRELVRKLDGAIALALSAGTGEADA